MKYTLSEIIDVDDLKHLCESFTAINGTVTAILDLQGNVLVSTGWQAICTQFHRMNPQTRNRCKESDTMLAGQLERGKKYNVYKCKNGLIDVAIPIVIDNEHVGNFFTGQLLTENPDIEYFRQQAKQFGFDEKKYLDALEDVPVFKEEQIKNHTEFLVKLTETIGKTGLKKLKSLEQAKQLELEQIKLNQINKEFAALNEEYITQNEELQQKNNELNLAKEKAEESEERFNLAMKASNDGIFDWNLETNDIYYSPGWKKMLGYEDHELPNDFSIWEKTTDPEDVMKSWELQQKLIKKQIDRFVIEFKMKHKAGHWVDVLARAEAIFNDNGKAVRLIGTHTDITKRKQIEIELAESAERYRALHNASFGGIVIHDKGVIIECNQGLAEMTGYSLNELIGMDGLLLIAPDSRDFVMSNILAGYEKPYQANGLRKNGNIYPMRLEARNIPYKGKHVRTVEFRDITESKLTEQKIIAAKEKAEKSEKETKQMYQELAAVEEELRASHEELIVTSDALNDSNTELINAKEKAEESEKLFYNIFNNLNSGVAIYEIIDEGKDFIFKYFNKAAERIDRQDKSELIGQSIFKARPNVEEFGLIDAFRKVLKSKKPGLLPINVYNDDKIEGYYENFFFLLPSGELVTVFDDLTEQKKYEFELKQAKETAEQNSRLKTAFLNNLSHEIRTPLNAICGFSSMLDNPNLDKDKRRNFVSIIHKSSDQLLAIVSDVITISSLETNLESIDTEAVNINEIMNELLATFKQQTINSDISVYSKNELTGQQAIVFTDKTKLTQILKNLISNALKFTHEGYIEFGYEYVQPRRGVALPHSELQFYVKDTGIGIHPDLHDKIFEQFRQAGKTIHQTYGGTGLGLSISKGFAELLGGRIWVNSEVGKGSTFYFTIPYKTANQTKETKTSIEPKINTGNATILIAEDEEFNYLYLEELLIDFEYALIHARDGQEAVELFKANPGISLILMDIKMPIMTGYEAAKIIKEQKPDLPIIAQTAYALEHEIEKYIGIFDDYLAKPIKDDILIRKVSKYMNNR